MDDWQVGDLALCVDDGPLKIIDGLNETQPCFVERLVKGHIYTVTVIVYGKTCPCVGLGFHAERAGGVSSRFIKVTPPQADEFDREVIDLMTRVPAHLDSEG